MDHMACVFVDGENLRHSLRSVLAGADDPFHGSNYLPIDADWTHFFDWIVHSATQNTRHRLRAYWFVTEEIDCYPTA